jgi:signal transduction histidine kinase
MDLQESQRRQNYLGLTPEDGANVRLLREAFEHHADQFAERFYEHLLSSPETAPFLQNATILERLKRLQAEYFSQLLDGVFDEAYVAKRVSVGQTHHRFGIEPVLYLGAYNQYIQLTFPLFAEAFGNNLGAVLPSLLSLVKVIFFDIAVALDTYFQAATEQMRRRNTELQHALGLVQRSHQREEQLRRLLSHEIRGGLSAMITSLEEIRDLSPLEGEPGKELESTLRRAWLMSDLLTEMLTQPRHESPGRTDTASLMQGLRTRFRLYGMGRDIQLILPESPPPVWADAAQLREVFGNLLANAVRYMDKPHGRIEILAQPFSPRDAPPDCNHPAGDYVLFGLRDNGPGLPEAVRQRRFEPAPQGPGGCGPKEGTGLGLYFVRTLVEQGGGRVWYETQMGKGTCFWFTVPGAPVVSADSPPSSTPGVGHG